MIAQRKILRDLWTARGRVAFMVLSLAAGLTSLGTVLAMRGVLRREMTRNYLDTVPASATFELGEGGVSGELLARVRTRPEVAAAERRATLVGRWRKVAGAASGHAPRSGPWGRALLFVREDFERPRLAKLRHLSGPRTPPPGTVLVERSALRVLGAGVGDTLEVSVAGGQPTRLRVVGVVHEPALAPAVQEQTAYLYASVPTLVRLGRPAALDELRVLVSRRPLDAASVDAQIVRLASFLRAEGVPLHDVQIPPPGKHPHEAPSNAILLLLVIFAGLTLILASVLSASLFGTTLARQVREIAVLKTLGATRASLRRLYALMLLAVALMALLASVGPTILLARLGIDSVSRLLNFDIASYAVPLWAYGLWLGAAILVPLATAAPVILRASRVSVRAALDEHRGSVPGGGRLARLVGALPSRLLQAALRNALRVPRRLALTVGLLAVAGALFVSAASVSGAWSTITARVHETRRYDLELQLTAPADAALLRALPGASRVEVWGSVPVTLAAPSGLPISRTYPDKGHGSFALVAAPDDTRLVRFTLRAGRWLRPGEAGAVVLNQLAAARVSPRPLGREISLVVDGRASRWRVVGVIEEVAAPANAYVSQRAFRQQTGQALRTLRVSLASDPAGDHVDHRAQALADRLAASGSPVESILTRKLLFNAMGEHVGVLVRLLLGLALLMAAVGSLSLGATMSTSVVERTREIGVLRAIGARPAEVRIMILAEGLFVALLSLPLALLMAAPLSAVVGHTVGDLAFRIPLPLWISWGALGLWSVAVLVVSTLASLVPASLASRRRVTEALGHV